MAFPALTEEQPVSEQAIACFAHGLAHLMSDRGAERGLEEAAEMIEGIRLFGAGSRVGSERSLRGEKALQE